MNASPSRGTDVPSDTFRVFLLNLEVDPDFWWNLPSSTRNSLRESCSSAQHLADVMTISLMYDQEAMEALDQPATLLQCTALVAKLPRLLSLTVLMAPDATAADLRHTLAAFGAACAGRVTTLSVSAPSVTAAVCLAICAAYPLLQRLAVARDEQRFPVTLHDMALRPSGAATALMPLGGATALCKLTLGSTITLWADTLASIGALTRLQELDVGLGHVCADSATLPAGLQPWTALTNLTRCRLARTAGGTVATLTGVAALLTLTRLTHLEFASLHNEREEGREEDEFSNDSDEPAPVALPTAAAAFALLGGMLNLQSLHLGDMFRLDGAALPALASLTRLTELGVGETDLLEGEHAAGAALPALQRLRIRAGLSPAALLTCLRPLLPLLPALTHLQPASDHADDKGLSVLTVGGLPSRLRGEAQGAAMGRVAELLAAAAPRLLLHAVAFVSLPCAVGALVGALQPLADRVTRLEFSQACSLSGQDLVAIARGFPALRQLRLRDGAARGMSQADWLKLASLVAAPLQLEVRPPPPLLLIGLGERCLAEGERVYGRGYMSFV